MGHTAHTIPMEESMKSADICLGQSTTFCSEWLALSPLFRKQVLHISIKGPPTQSPKRGHKVTIRQTSWVQRLTHELCQPSRFACRSLPCTPRFMQRKVTFLIIVIHFSEVTLQKDEYNRMTTEFWIEKQVYHRQSHYEEEAPRSEERQI